MEIRAKSRQQIADEYGISAKTLARWLQRENIQVTKGLVTPREQELIYAAFGQTEKKTHYKYVLTFQPCGKS